MATAAEITKQCRGKTAYLAGETAERLVQKQYEQSGLVLAAHRWRGGGAEIDLIFRDGALCVFVEVKQSKDWQRASQSLSSAQMQRIMTAATVFVAHEPKGQLTDMRFDVALVDGQGRTQILENALILG
ncbi:YraN family protein [Cognatishimia sp. WU-CL00825]|uniref:YraN family protein n=1 Tax=Cognatishimia sp. WU-CL00825 TaxID=3127658 RepID=UPI003101E832